MDNDFITALIDAFKEESTCEGCIDTESVRDNVAKKFKHCVTNFDAYFAKLYEEEETFVIPDTYSQEDYWYPNDWDFICIGQDKIFVVEFDNRNNKLSKTTTFLQDFRIDFDKLVCKRAYYLSQTTISIRYNSKYAIKGYLEIDRVTGNILKG